MKDITAIEKFLRDRGCRLTAPRKRVLGLLIKEGRPLSAQELFERARRQVDLATVYRVMRLFLDLGLVRQAGTVGGSALYEIEGEEHHHHLFCRECGRAEEIEGCFMSSLEEELSRKKRFRVTGHVLEFYGICHDCEGGRV